MSVNSIMMAQFVSALEEKKQTFNVSFPKSSTLYVIDATQALLQQSKRPTQNMLLQSQRWEKGKVKQANMKNLQFPKQQVIPLIATVNKKWNLNIYFLLQCVSVGSHSAFRFVCVTSEISILN